jgi:predicted RNA-binding Zn ribbon-like protein
VPSNSILSGKLAGEELCIRFVNTVAWRLRDPVEDRAASPEVMLKWLVDADLIDRPTALKIKAHWKRSPRAARSFLQDAARLREAIYALCLARIAGRKADPAANEILNAHLSGASKGLGLAQSHKAMKWRLRPGDVDPQALLKPLAWSAAALLTGPRAQKVRQCQDERGCGWLFIDESRAQNRRWCSMGNCGNLAKSRRHHRRVAHSPQ